MQNMTWNKSFKYISFCLSLLVFFKIPTMVEEVSTLCDGVLHVKRLVAQSRRRRAAMWPGARGQSVSRLQLPAAWFPPPNCRPTGPQHVGSVSQAVVTTLFKTKLPDGGERRISAEETCAPWPAWRRSWRRRASTSTCCRLIFHREPCPAVPALEQGTRGSWSTGRIMKGQYNYRCASTFPSEFKNENRTYDSLKYLLFGVCVQLSEFIGGGAIQVRLEWNMKLKPKLSCPYLYCVLHLH